MTQDSENTKTAIASDNQELDVPLGTLKMRVRQIGLIILGALLLLSLWEVCVVWLRVPSYILPAPQQVFRILWVGIAISPGNPASFYIPLLSTMQNAFLGYIFGVLAGVAIGSILAEFRPIETMAMPYFFALQSLPKVAIAPLIIIWCGFGEGSKVAMAALMTFFPMMVNTFTGLRATELDRLDLMRALSASRWEVYRVVKLPSAAPYIFAGLNMGIVYALLGTLIAEFLGSQQGVGVVILQAQAIADTASVFAILVLLALIGMALHWVVGYLQRRIIHWQTNN